MPGAESCTLGAICCEAAKRTESRGLAYTRSSKAQPIRVAYRQSLSQRLSSEMRVQGPFVAGITQRADSALVRWFLWLEGCFIVRQENWA